MNQKSEKRKNSVAIFGSIRIMACASIFIALSIVFGKYVPLLNIDVLRFSLENLPILMAGIVFGPIVGGVVGGVADLIGCVLVGYTINPVVTIGSIAIGALSGVCSHFLIKRFSLLQVALSVGVAHLIGSVVIKSIGLAAFYSWPLYQLMLIRLANYAILAVCETTIIYILLKNKSISSQFDRIKSGKGRRD